jgi:hypothetical protein
MDKAAKEETVQINVIVCGETNRSVKEPVGLFDLQEREKQSRKKAKSRVKPVMTAFCVSSLSPLIPT